MQEKKVSQESWVSVSELAEHLGVSTSWVRKAVRDQLIPVGHCGRTLRFKKSAVDEAIEGGAE
jgi:excisionase family DNA binding protein